MEWFANLFVGTGVAQSVFVIALTIVIGVILGKIKFHGISLGVTWVLFVGILLGHLGLSLTPETGHFAKDFGLILFVYSIGMQVGPHFFQSFKAGGIKLNLLAVGCIVMADLLCVAFHSITGVDFFAMIGILNGAITNTPGLGAAQQTFSDLNGGASNPVFSSGYAVAYPLAVVGLISGIILMHSLFRNRLSGPSYAAAESKPVTPVAETSKSPNVLIIFLGIALGVILGSIPIPIPGMSVPVKLGLAGGPLIMAICIAAFGPRIHLNTYIAPSANMMLREIGISLFLATVGIDAGGSFISTLCNGGYWWVLYGFLITIIPVLIISFIAYYLCHVSFYSIAGMLSGTLTDPPALAYSNSICPTDEVSVAYSTVYPLSMFMRIISAQVLVLIAMG
jgi:AspT/YidE/YbjL antiporter-like protein